MFDHTILVVSMWILSCKGTSAVPGQTQIQQMLPGLRLVQVSLQECIQVYCLFLPFILLAEPHRGIYFILRNVFMLN